MLLRLSSKGQLVIPKTIRESMRLKNGDQFQVRVVDGKIVLDPVAKGLVEKLHGKYAGQNMLKALEEEHKREIENE
ncbi:MAG TPA: AbrB/MazE/SpoVT family DNA-binding domain-containing protein [Anaerolineales bacterium]|nr:AbrB/MazE/SpoVT family DNA-binding domain-containing protein [Anaerolineales bacterium]HQU38214.1 AbrB/MazE/SpoVT family DNA-binding domain-containing protein [Anaerolineales bacterium]